jgi:iron complex outermembrane receptor protein
VWLSPHWKIRAAAGRAFRLPTFTDLYYHDPANRGSPDLRPESAWTFEAGAEWHPAAGWQGEVAIFQRRERDGIDYVRREPGGLWRAENIHRLCFTGIEVNFSAALKRRYRLDFGYTALDGAQTPLAGAVSRYVFNYPRHQGVAGLLASLPADTLVRSRAGIVNRLGRPSYTLWDIYVARARGPLHPFVQVANVTGTSYQEVLGVSMPGRSVVVGIELKVPGR